MPTIQIFIVLIAIVAGGAAIARRLTIPPSIILVVVGIALSLIPGVPRVELDPELALTIILPPLLYWAGVSMSWPEFKRNIKPIALLAVGCVVFTAAAVAAAAHLLLGVPWAVAFVLGAIVSPPDVVAPMAIVRPLGLPRRLMVILEGEGLVNDATALIFYRFAVVAVGTGSFSLLEAGGSFAAILVGEIIFGLAVGWATLRLRRWLNEPRIELTVALLTPYLAFWVPHDLGGSGVLATVAAGLYVSWNGPLLISAETRLQGSFFWDLYVYLIEGIVFLITGLQARTIIERVDGGWTWLLAAAATLTLLVMLVRFLWVFPVTYLPRYLAWWRRRDEPLPAWQPVFALAFTGVRGVVSLAAALAIPLTTQSGEPFPYRDLLLFLSFAVIVATLIGEGLVIPYVFRWLKLGDLRAEEEATEQEKELAARVSINEKALAHLSAIQGRGETRDDMILRLRARIEERWRHWSIYGNDASSVSLAQSIEREVIGVERMHVFGLLRQGEITDEARRRLEHELDLEESRLRAQSDLLGAAETTPGARGAA